MPVVVRSVYKIDLIGDDDDDAAFITEEPCPKHRALGVNADCPDCDHSIGRDDDD